MGKIKFDEILTRYRGLVISFSILLLSILISILVFSLMPLMNKATPVSDEDYVPEKLLPVPEITLSDYELEDFNTRFENPGVYYKRPVLKKWDKEQVQKFFIPVEKVLLDMLEKENEKVINDIFSPLE